MIINYWQSPVCVGTRSFGRFIGSPLDGVTNWPFRSVVRNFSPDALLYTEICHCDTIVRGNHKKWGLYGGEKSINFQMCASDTTYIAAACERVLAAGIDMVDINIGCPAKTVINRGAGSALMADSKKLSIIIQEFRRYLPCTLTVKMRAGFKEYNALTIAQMLEDLGINALCVHPRLQSQGFTGNPDYSLVGSIKRSVKLPVFVSGGINSFSDAKMVYDQTGVDGFLIGRALTGRPWLLRQMTQESQGMPTVVGAEIIIKTVFDHLDRAVAWFGPTVGLAYLKKHLKIYCADLGFERNFTIKLLQTEEPEQFRSLLDGELL